MGESEDHTSEIYSVAEAAYVLDVHPRTLLTLERRGIVLLPRTAAGHRRYSVAMLAVIRQHLRGSELL